MTCRIEVRVQPGARRNEVTNRAGEVRVRVTAPAERGKANEAVVALSRSGWACPSRHCASCVARRRAARPSRSTG